MISIPYQVADSGLDALGVGRRQVEGVVGRRRVGLRLRLGRALDPAAGEGRRLARDAAAGEQVAPPPRPRDRPDHDGQGNGEAGRAGNEQGHLPKNRDKKKDEDDDPGPLSPRSLP